MRVLLPVLLAYAPRIPKPFYAVNSVICPTPSTCRDKTLTQVIGGPPALPNNTVNGAIWQRATGEKRRKPNEEKFGSARSFY